MRVWNGLLILLFILAYGIQLSAQEDRLKTGFYSVVENDSCGMSGDYLKIRNDAEEYCIDKIPLITSNNFTSVRIDSDTTKEGIYRTVRIKLDSTVAQEFKETTTRLVGKRLAFVINNKIITAPVLRDPIESGEIAVFCDDETIDIIKKEFGIK